MKTGRSGARRKGRELPNLDRRVLESLTKAEYEAVVPLLSEYDRMRLSRKLELVMRDHPQGMTRRELLRATNETFDRIEGLIEEKIEAGLWRQATRRNRRGAATVTYLRLHNLLPFPESLPLTGKFDGVE